MKKLVFLLYLVLQFSFIAFSQRAARIHRKAILIDTHNDVLSSAVLDGVDISNRVTEGHSDLVRWKEGGMDVQFFSVWTGEKAKNKEGFYRDAEEQIDLLGVLTLKNPQRMTLAGTYRDVKRGIRQGKLVALIGVEGGHMIEDDLGKLEALAKHGMRYMTLTWNNSTSWATSARDETDTTLWIPRSDSSLRAQRSDSSLRAQRSDSSLRAQRSDSSLRAQRSKGLTDFGKQVVQKMNQLGVIVDLSHVGEQTFYDAIATTTKPVILSHSSVWNLCPVFRNVKDDQIKAVAKNGGVICVNFYSGFISKEYEDRSEYFTSGAGRKALDDSVALYSRNTTLDSVAARSLRRKFYREEMKKYQPSLGQLIDHIDYIVKLVGDDHAGIGSDFDGVSSLPVGLDDVTTYPKITEELIRRGYSKKSIRKILGGNVMRVMKANFKK